VKALAHDILCGLRDLVRVPGKDPTGLHDRVRRLEYGFLLFCVGRIAFGPTHEGSIRAAEAGLVGYFAAAYSLGLSRRAQGRTPATAEYDTRGPHAAEHPAP
jgi:hypothetical protein